MHQINLALYWPLPSEAGIVSFILQKMFLLSGQSKQVQSLGFIHKKLKQSELNFLQLLVKAFEFGHFEINETFINYIECTMQTTFVNVCKLMH